ncbi:MAG TPA: uracil phosphoribosyltransferase [Cyclobacteriaceae bacterium]|nr:uracil phosphoribosyltransferase [Cyclobacteriaceae bacterium]
MTVRQLSDQDSVANQFLSELRDVQVQKDRLRFRHNLERLGEIMAYEISKELPYSVKSVQTPLGVKKINMPAADIVLITIMRAGLPLLEGFQRIFDRAEVGFISSYRVEGEGTITVKTEYMATPDLTGKTVMLIDTMLASGRSVADAVTALEAKGRPGKLYLASVIAAPEGIAYLTKNIKQAASLWTFSIDERLNANFYIVPGIGDAGDLAFGPK